MGVEIAGAGDANPDMVELHGGGWTGEEALSIAVFCVLVSDTPRDALLSP